MTYEKILEYYHQFFPEIEIDEFSKIMDFMNPNWKNILVDLYEKYDDVDDFDVENVADFRLDSCIKEYLRHSENNVEKQMVLIFALPIVNCVINRNNELFESEGDLLNKSARKNILDSCVDIAIEALYRTVVSESSYYLKEKQKEGISLESALPYYFDVELKKKSKIEDFYKEYQAITEYVCSRLQFFINYICEIKRHIKEDKEILRTEFGVEVETCCIEKMVFGTGDTHCEGRSVTEISFKGEIVVFYKPHSVDADVKFYQLLAFLDKKADVLDFKSPVIVSRKGYGYCK